MKLVLLIVGVFIANLSYAKEYHVSPEGSNSNNGSFSKPFKTISEAVKYAYPGDTITVHKGVYREWVNPVRGGESDTKRIVYRAAPGEKVEIKGSEVITGWEKENNGIWKVVIPNTFFEGYNPYQDSIFGDWFNDHGRIHHTGEVFLNGKSLFEKEKLDLIFKPIPDNRIEDEDGSVYTWYCESDAQNTTIWANFQKFNPNKELIEISVRNKCFYPGQPGINYITISGFDISQAATQWAAPTAEQIGMLATHWNKGWVIENNIIHDSKCSGITLGKERSTGHNVWSADPAMDGSLHYIEVVFRTLRNGWSKAKTGSHIVRNNDIYNCEQTGICGSMGAAFSIVENNHIHHIWTKRQFSGAEIAGMKIHAGIDMLVKGNRINNCGRGTWFDWMTQGVRISQNIMYNNDLEDIYFEVNHGPFLVDNNILLSEVGVVHQSQGGAFVHNLFAGETRIWAEPGRYTPYHLPHSTEIAGVSVITPGDDRFYNNIFIGKGPETKKSDIYNYGLSTYNDSIKLAWGASSKRKIEQQFWINNNVYFNGAVRYRNEKNYIEELNYNPDLKLVQENGSAYLQFLFDDLYFNFKTQLITTAYLGKTKLSKEAYENPDGTPLQINADYFGNRRSDENILAGPFSNLDRGKARLKVW